MGTLTWIGNRIFEEFHLVAVDLRARSFERETEIVAIVLLKKKTAHTDHEVGRAEALLIHLGENALDAIIVHRGIFVIPSLPPFRTIVMKG